MVVSTHSRPKAAGYLSNWSAADLLVSTHSRLKVAGSVSRQCLFRINVSTHSRLKAAGSKLYSSFYCTLCFNTQPPEGGWANHKLCVFHDISFNTQPPEGGWGLQGGLLLRCGTVSTHSRLKAAGLVLGSLNFVSQRFNTQPPEGGWRFIFSRVNRTAVSTHSRPKAAGNRRFIFVSTHSRPKAAGLLYGVFILIRVVSTHSRPKAAGSLYSRRFIL